MPNMRKRLSKDARFMNIAQVISQCSPDPKTQVGSVIVDSKYRIISTGYNGPPPGFDNDSIDWLDRSQVYPIVVHSEVNSILYANSRFDGAKMYVTLSPCGECIKLLAAAGIKIVIYRDEYRDINEVKLLAEKFGLTLIKHEE